MKKALSFIALALVFTTPVPSAFAADEVSDCRALRASLGPQRAVINRESKALEELAEIAERAGEAWENAENVRVLSAEHAAKADELRPAYEQTRDAFNKADGELFDKVQKFNADQSRFNSLCAG